MNASKLRRGSGKAATRKTGPNDAIRVVWAISTCFHFLIGFFFLLIHIYRYYGCYGATEGCAGFYEEKNGPKRRVSRRLGHMVSFFYLYSCFFIHTLIL